MTARAALVAVGLATLACSPPSPARRTDSALAPTSSGDAARVARMPDESADSLPQATAPTVVEHYTAAELDRILRSLSSRTTAGFGRSHPTFHYVEARRLENGSPEVHDDWIDVAIGQAGRATILLGGSVSGSHMQSSGEHRGGTITGGHEEPFGAGDVMVIPAGVPHEYRVVHGDSVRYLTIKIHR